MRHKVDVKVRPLDRLSIGLHIFYFEPAGSTAVDSLCGPDHATCLIGVIHDLGMVI